MKPVMPKFPKWSTVASGRIFHCFEVWKAADGWRWRMWARSGRVIAEGGEAYTTRWRTLEMACVVRGLRDYPIWVRDRYGNRRMWRKGMTL